MMTMMVPGGGIYFMVLCASVLRVGVTVCVSVVGRRQSSSYGKQCIISRTWDTYLHVFISETMSSHTLSLSNIPTHTYTQYINKFVYSVTVIIIKTHQMAAWGVGARTCIAVGKCGLRMKMYLIEKSNIVMSCTI